RRRGGRPLEEAVLARRRLPGPGRRLPVRRGRPGRARPARRRPVGPRAHRLAVGLFGHPGRPRRDPGQGRDPPGRRRPPPGRTAAGQGVRRRAPLLRHGPGAAGRRRPAVPPADPRPRAVPADPGAGDRGRRPRRPVLHPPRHRRPRRHRPAADPAAPGVRAGLQQAPVSASKVGAVIITMGNRPDELRALLDSLARQQGDPVHVVVVGNGSPVPDVAEFSDTVRAVELPENLGIPGGRNIGIEAFGPGGRDVDILLFLDDDGLLAGEDTAELCREAFAADPALGIISFRIADPETGVTQRRHVPRLRASDPMRSSRVTTFLGGANAVRTQVFAEVGGLPDAFFYAHEETDLAWRALDAGWMIDYRSDMVLYHPT